MARSEDAAYGQFHAAYFNRLSRYILVLMRGDGTAAADVMQECMLRVVRNIRQFMDEEAFWHWLTLLARCAAADHGRKASRYRKFLSLFASEPVVPPSPPEDDVMRAAVDRAMASLPAAERDILVLKYEMAESVRALASREGITEDAMESRLARARKSLREATFKFLKHEEK